MKVGNMSNIKVRLITSTALVTALVGFFNLPAGASNPEFMEGQTTARTTVSPGAYENVGPVNYDDLKAQLQIEMEQSQKKDSQDDVQFEHKTNALTNPYLEPLVEFKDGKVVARKVTKDVVDDLKDMNDLAYNMVKGYGYHQELAQPVLERLQKAGWKWKNFSGLEGLNSEFGISAGMVFYHPQKNLAKVVIAGTSSNDEGWHVNGKSNLTNLTPADLQKAYFDDLIGEVESMVKAALNPKAKAIDPKTSVSQEVMNILHDKIGVGINYLDGNAVRLIAARTNRLAFNKPEMSEEWLRSATLTSVKQDLAKTKLTDQQQETIAKVLTREAMEHFKLDELAKDKDYQAALKEFLKDTVQYYKNATHNGVKERLADFFKKHKDEFETVANSEEEKKPHGLAKLKSLLGKKKAEKKPSFGPKTKEQSTAETVENNADHSLGKAILAFGDLKLMIQAGKLGANKAFADRLYKVFNLKMQVMETVAKMEDKANAKGKTTIGQGSVHLGFMQKSVSMVDEVAGILKEFGVNENSKVLVSGHSQAGGTGAQTLALLAESYGDELFGEGFDNKKTNNLSGYFFSMARAGDQDYADYVNDMIGKDNVIRHNVHGDPVPIANGNEAFANLIKNLSPVVYGLMYKNMGFGDIGTLALQDGHETYLEAKKLYAADGYDVSKFDTLDLALQYIAGKAAKGAPIEVIGKVTEAEFLKQPFTWLDQKLNTGIADKIAVYKMVKKIYNATVKGDEATQKELADLFTKRYAPFHLGYEEGMKKDTLMGAHFKPELILDTDKCLEAGRKHEEVGVN
jgi:hypothetical protein